MSAPISKGFQFEVRSFDLIMIDFHALSTGIGIETFIWDLSYKDWGMLIIMACNGLHFLVQIRLDWVDQESASLQSCLVGLFLGLVDGVLWRRNGTRSGERDHNITGDWAGQYNLMKDSVKQKTGRRWCTPSGAPSEILKWRASASSEMFKCSVAIQSNNKWWRSISVRGIEWQSILFKQIQSHINIGPLCP
jgi:hypothetical protein